MKEIPSLKEGEKTAKKMMVLPVIFAVLILSLSVQSFYYQPSGIIVVDPAYKKVTLIKPTPLRGCNGLIFGTDGALYVCQSGANTISRIELRDGCRPRVATFVGPYHGVYVPDDITVDDKGNFYATSAITGEVYKINSLGMKKVIARGLLGPNGISYDEETGRLFMSECFWGNRVWELDPEGVDPPRLVTAALSVPEGFDITDGKLVIPDFGTWTIVEVDMDTGAINPIVTAGLITPIALKIGPDGYIYTVELATGAVKKISPNGTSIETIATLLPGVDNLAFSPDGRLFVSSYHDSTIWKVELDGSGEYTALFPMGINTPASLVVKDEKLYLCDSIMIRMIDEEGNLHKTVANAWLLPTHYPLPITMTNGIGDNLITADFIDGIVVTVNPNTGVWAPIAYPVTSPAGMRLDEENLMLYVTEYGAGQVTEVNLTNGDRRVVAKDLSGPVDVVIKDGSLYVAEALAGRITKVDIATGVKEVFLAGYVGKPKGLAWDHEGNLLIVDAAMEKLVKVNMENLRISTVACNLPVAHTTYYHHPLIWDSTAAIAVNEKGDIFIAGSVDGSVTKLEYVGLPPWWHW